MLTPVQKHTDCKIKNAIFKSGKSEYYRHVFTQEEIYLMPRKSYMHIHKHTCTHYYFSKCNSIICNVFGHIEWHTVCLVYMISIACIANAMFSHVFSYTFHSV